MWGTNLCVDVGDLLNRAAFAGAEVLGGDDAAVGTLAELLDKLIFGIDDEGGVERLEGVPLHRGKWRNGWGRDGWVLWSTLRRKKRWRKGEKRGTETRRGDGAVLAAGTHLV